MPLYFTDKKRRWPPSKPMQYILAILALVIAITVLIVWLYLRFVYTDSTSKPSDQEETPSAQDLLPDAAYCLLIIEDVDHEQFALIETNPQKQSIVVTPISSSLQSADHVSLATILRKQGPVKATAALADIFGVPVTHYASFSTEDAESFLNRLGDNLPFAPAEDVLYHDENGAAVRLTTDERPLTATQIGVLLRYTQWENRENATNLLSELTVALFNHFLRSNRSLDGYFRLLSDTAATDLRIDHFNRYRNGFEHLADNNDGNVAKMALPNITTIAKETP